VIITGARDVCSPTSPFDAPCGKADLHVYAMPTSLASVRFCRCGRVARSEAQDAAQSAADVFHEGFGQMGGRRLEGCLVEGDQGGDVND
jgi:hypothetical protein